VTLATNNVGEKTLAFTRRTRWRQQDLRPAGEEVNKKRFGLSKV